MENCEDDEDVDERPTDYLKVTVIPLSEPLKVRTITKCQALETYVSKCLQKNLKKYIDQFDCFLLTTRPLQPNDFRTVWKKEESLEQKISSYFGYDFHFNFTSHSSIDYKAATDKLNPNFTRILFERSMIALRVPEEDKAVYRRVLYMQRLTYPKRFSAELRKTFPHLDVSTKLKNDFPNEVADEFIEDFSINQVNGQLMGSVLSFPILCLANAICYKKAIEEYINRRRPAGRKFFKVSLNDLPCLINGDDGYFRSDPELVAIWFRYITIAGFELSIGKNYVHKNGFTINSQCFTYDKSKDLLEESTYLNVGQLIGRSKSGDSEGALPIWDLFNKVMKNCHNTVWVKNRFFHFHRDRIREVSYKGFYNLFIPRILGGLGFEVPETKVNFLQWQSSPFVEKFPKVQRTQRQLQLAVYFHNQIRSMHTTPIIGAELLSSCMSQITLIDENKPDFHEPYAGDFSFKSIIKDTTIPEVDISTYRSDVERSLAEYIPVEEVVPSDFHELKDAETVNRFMIHNQFKNFTPKPVYKGISSKVWFKFLNSDRYQGNIDYFGAAAYFGKYRYRIISSVYPQPNSFESNFLNVYKGENSQQRLIDLVVSKLPNEVIQHLAGYIIKRKPFAVLGPKPIKAFGIITPIRV